MKVFSALAVFVLLGLLTANRAQADDPQTVVGFWATQDSILEVARVGESLSMRVVALENPTYLEGEPHGPPGAVRVDVNNIVNAS